MTLSCITTQYGQTRFSTFVWTIGDILHQERYTFDIHVLLSNFQDPPPHLPSFVQTFSTPLTLDFQFQRKPLPLQMITNQLKENIIQGWLLYIIRFFLQFGFCSQYQLINLVWLSIEFFPFSWSQTRSQSCFEKLKNSFSPSSYNEKMCWGQDRAKASLSAFSWLYILVSAVV